MREYSFAELNNMALDMLERLGLPFPTEAQIQCTERFFLEVVLADRHWPNIPYATNLARNEHYDTTDKGSLRAITLNDHEKNI